MRNASKGEYTIRISAPRDLISSKSCREPGTLSISPNEVKITLFFNASCIAVSIMETGVTQTGHPGPCISFISLGSSGSMR